MQSHHRLLLARLAFAFFWNHDGSCRATNVDNGWSLSLSLSSSESSPSTTRRFFGRAEPWRGDSASLVLWPPPAPAPWCTPIDAEAPLAVGLGRFDAGGRAARCSGCFCCFCCWRRRFGWRWRRVVAVAVGVAVAVALRPPPRPPRPRPFPLVNANCARSLGLRLGAALRARRRAWTCSLAARAIAMASCSSSITESSVDGVS